MNQGALIGVVRNNAFAAFILGGSRAAARPIRSFSGPDAFTPAFFRDASKLQQWAAFVRELSVQPPSFQTVVTELAVFFSPYLPKTGIVASAAAPRLPPGARYSADASKIVFAASADSVGQLRPDPV